MKKTEAERIEIAKRWIALFVDGYRTGHGEDSAKKYASKLTVWTRDGKVRVYGVSEDGYVEISSDGKAIDKVVRANSILGYRINATNAINA